MKTKKIIISLILLTIVELSVLYLSRLNINNFTQKTVKLSLENTLPKRKNS